MSVPHLTATDDGRTLSLRVKDEFEIVLEGSPTTGFSWEQARPVHVAQMTAEPEYMASKDAPGSSGAVKLKFMAVRSGESRLTLDYRRPFEKDAAPDKSYAIDLVVR